MSLRGLPRPLWVLFAATLINRAGWVVMPFLTLYLTRDLGLTPSQAGGTLALAGVAGIATSPIAGSLADRLGPRPIMLASMFLSAAILLGFPLVKSYLGVLAAAAALAASLELFRPANLAVVSQLLDEQQRPLGFSLMRLATSLGMSVGPAVSGVLVQTSFTLLFVVDAATTFAAATILLVAFRPAATLNHARPTLSSTDRSIVALLANERLRWFLLPVLLVMLVLSQHFSTVSLYLTRDLHLPASIYGLTFTVNMLLVATLQVPLTAATASSSSTARGSGIRAKACGWATKGSAASSPT